jgi:hypothetical protein
MLGSFRRRFLEVLFDGKPEAVEDLAKAAENYKAVQAKFRERLVVPADQEAVGRLAARYTSPELGVLAVLRQGSSTVFDLGEWRSSVASRKNDDGTISFLTIDPGGDGFEFVEANATTSARSLCARANTNTFSRKRYSRVERKECFAQLGLLQWQAS